MKYVYMRQARTLSAGSNERLADATSGKRCISIDYDSRGESGSGQEGGSGASGVPFSGHGRLSDPDGVERRLEQLSQYIF